MTSRGSYEKRGEMWNVRYRDDAGSNRRQSGFRTKQEAIAWLDERNRKKRAGLKDDPTLTFRKVGAMYLEQHDASEARLAKLGFMLQHAYDAFGDVPIADLAAPQLGRWRKTISEGTRHDATAAVKQVLKACVLWRFLEVNPADALPNPRPERKESMPFQSWAEVDGIEEAIVSHYRGLPTVVVGSGLRPQEWPKLRIDHIDWDGCALNLPKQIVKKGTPARRVPLRARCIDALRMVVGERTSGLVFTTPTGDAIDIRNFRNRVWGPALERAGLGERRPYDMRHTYATWSLRAGQSTFALARRMGTSVAMIDETYGHFTTDSEAHELFLLDAFDRGIALGTEMGTTGSVLPVMDTAEALP